MRIGSEHPATHIGADANGRPVHIGSRVWWAGRMYVALREGLAPFRSDRVVARWGEDLETVEVVKDFG